MSNVQHLSTAQAARVATMARQAQAVTDAANARIAIEKARAEALTVIEGIMATLALLEGGQIGREEALKRIRADVRPFLRSQAPA